MEDASISTIIILLVISYVVIPLILFYRRGFFINWGSRFEWLHNIFNKKSKYLPEDWTVVKVRPLSKFEKKQIRSIVIKFNDNLTGELRYLAVITLNSGKTVKYIFDGVNKGYWLDDTIHKDNILLRTWQKGNEYYYDLVPIKGKSD